MGLEETKEYGDWIGTLDPEYVASAARPDLVEKFVKGKFNPGRVVATPAAIARAEQHGIDLPLLVNRHRTGDWGDIDTHDVRVNEQALKDGSRILSAYGEGDQKLWIITDASHSGFEANDRQITTILRPEDY